MHGDYHQVSVTSRVSYHQKNALQYTFVVLSLFPVRS